MGGATGRLTARLDRFPWRDRVHNGGRIQNLATQVTPEACNA